jgi:hypothetical protein
VHGACVDDVSRWFGVFFLLQMHAANGAVARFVVGFFALTAHGAVILACLFFGVCMLVSLMIICIVMVVFMFAFLTNLDKVHITNRAIARVVVGFITLTLHGAVILPLSIILDRSRVMMIVFVIFMVIFHVLYLF